MAWTWNSSGQFVDMTDEERAELKTTDPDCQWPADRYQGWISPDQGNWTVFVGVDGNLSLCVNGEMVFADAA